MNSFWPQRPLHLLMLAGIPSFVGVLLSLFLGVDDTWWKFTGFVLAFLALVWTVRRLHIERKSGRRNKWFWFPPT